MSALAQVVEERMDALERTMTEQVLALSNATTATMDRNLERMSAAAGQVDGLDGLVAESQLAFQERMLGHIDERMAQIARLVRSDSQALAGKLDEMGAHSVGRAHGVAVHRRIVERRDIHVGDDMLCQRLAKRLEHVALFRLQHVHVREDALRGFFD